MANMTENWKKGPEEGYEYTYQPFRRPRGLESGLYTVRRIGKMMASGESRNLETALSKCKAEVQRREAEAQAKIIEK